jgi:hypothetical protein
MSWANNAAHVTGKGNLTLGVETDDLAGDATHGYAKGDAWFEVPLGWLVDSCFVQAGTFARTSAGLYTLALAAAGSTGVVAVPLYWLFRKFTGAPVAAAPHGMKITDFVLDYIIATAAETTVSVAFFTNLDVNAQARASVATPFGAVTYENPIGTVVATLPVATQATPYVCRAIPATPIFVNVDNTAAFAEISCVNPGTAVITFTRIGFHASAALY